MFNDSEVVKSFSLSEIKCIAPHFKEELVKAVKASPYISLSFYKTLNGKIQEEQLGCHVTYWDDNRKEVCLRYLDSHFLRHPNAQNILNLYTPAFIE